MDKLLNIRPVSFAQLEHDAKNLVSQMTLDEKIGQLGGDSVFTTPAIPRLNIPAFNMSDGPCGISKYNGKATGFPSTLALASTWDPELAYEMAQALGNEFRSRGVSVALAPCINLIRDPRWGRSFESMGEDPFLASAISSSYIEGIQSQGVISVLKHFACNNKEDGRYTDNVAVSESILHNIYLRHFHDCIKKAKPWSIMSAYNKIDAIYCSENRHLLRDILKENWQFEGFVVSDWGACHSAKESIEAGLDIEMPNAAYFSKPLAELVRNGEVPMQLIDDAVMRVIAAKLWVSHAAKSVLQTPQTKTSDIILNAALNAVVMLKNDNALPIDRSVPQKIAVIGPLADAVSLAGGGSAEVDPFYSVSILDAINAHKSDKLRVSFAKGCFLNADQCRLADTDYKIMHDAGQVGFKAEFYAGENFEGSRLQARADEKIKYCWFPDTSEFGNIRPGLSARWSGTLKLNRPGRFALCAIANGSIKITLDGQAVFETGKRPEVPVPQYTEISLDANRPYELTVEFRASGGFKYEVDFFLADFDSEKLMNQACSLAAGSDINVICLGIDRFTESEGFDRHSLSLPANQLELLARIAAVSKKTLVVLQTGSVVLMDWHKQADAILQGWYNGQEFGNAIAEILLGNFNPCGKLPLSIPQKQSDLAPYDNDYNRLEGALGYRYYEAAGIAPLYPFGFGLSYSSFEYSDLQIEQPASGQDRLLISFTLTNTSAYEGTEIAQLYIRRLDKPSLYKDLRAFKKISLKGKTSTKVTIPLTDHDLAYYDTQKKDYSDIAARYSILIGSSSADISLQCEITLGR